MWNLDVRKGNLDNKKYLEDLRAWEKWNVEKEIKKLEKKLKEL